MSLLNYGRKHFLGSRRKRKIITWINKDSSFFVHFLVLVKCCHLFVRIKTTRLDRLQMFSRWYHTDNLRQEIQALEEVITHLYFTSFDRLTLTSSHMVRCCCHASRHRCKATIWPESFFQVLVSQELWSNCVNAQKIVAQNSLSKLGALWRRMKKQSSWIRKLIWGRCCTLLQ